MTHRSFVLTACGLTACAALWLALRDQENRGPTEEIPGISTGAADEDTARTPTATQPPPEPPLAETPDPKRAAAIVEPAAEPPLDGEHMQIVVLRASDGSPIAGARVTTFADGRPATVETNPSGDRKSVV